MKTKAKNKRDLLKLFYRASYYVCNENQNEKTISKANELVDKLIELLPFENDQEKERYIDLVGGFKFWEDWESETIRIINNLY